MKRMLWLTVWVTLVSGFTGSAIAQESPKVSYTTHGTVLRQVLKDLHEKTGGTPTYAAEPLASEPLIIRVQDVSADDLLKRLAEAVGGEWVRGATQHEIRPKALPKTSDADYQERLKKIQDMQATVRGRLAKLQTFDAKAAQNLVTEIEQYFQAVGQRSNQDYNPNDEKVGSSGPGPRLVQEIFASAPAELIAKMAPQDRVVWSINPTRKQIPLWSTAMPSIRTFVDAQKIWKKTLGGRTFNYPEDRGLPSNLYYLLEHNFQWSEPGDGDTSDASLVLVTCTTYGGDYFQIEVRLVDAKGKYVHTSSLSSYELLERTNEDQPEKGQPEPPKVTGLPTKAVAIPDDVAKVVAVLKSQMGREGLSSVPPITDDIAKKLLTPEQHDPISLVAGKTLVALAESNDAQLVGTLSDIASLYPLTVHEGTEVTFDKLIAGPKTPYSSTWYKVDGPWVIFGISDQLEFVGPFSTWNFRINRPNLGLAVREAKREGRISLDAQAKYVAGLPKDVDGLDFLYHIYMLLMFQERDAVNNEVEKLRFYGSMDAMQRRSIKEKQTLSYGSLRPEQKQMVDKFIFRGRNWEMEFDPGEGEMDMNRYELFHNGILGEPTYRFGNGIPQSAVLNMSDETKAMVYATRKSKYGEMTGASDLEDFGREMYYAEVREDDPDNRMEYGPYTSFVIKETRHVTIKIQLDKEVSYTIQLREDLQLLAKASELNQLPKQYYDVIQKGREKARLDHEEEKKHIPPPGSPMDFGMDLTFW